MLTGCLGLGSGLCLTRLSFLHMLGTSFGKCLVLSIAIPILKRCLSLLAPFLGFDVIVSGWFAFWLGLGFAAVCLRRLIFRLNLKLGLLVGLIVFLLLFFYRVFFILVFGFAVFGTVVICFFCFWLRIFGLILINGLFFFRGSLSLFGLTWCSALEKVSMIFGKVKKLGYVCTCLPC